MPEPKSNEKNLHDFILLNQKKRIGGHKYVYKVNKLLKEKEKFCS